MFLVHDSDLIISSVVVHFGNGETFKPSTKLVFEGLAPAASGR